METRQVVLKRPLSSPDIRREPTPLPHRVTLRASPLPHHPRIRDTRRHDRGPTRRSKPGTGLGLGLGLGDFAYSDSTTSSTAVKRR